MQKIHYFRKKNQIIKYLYLSFGIFVLFLIIKPIFEKNNPIVKKKKEISHIDETSKLNISNSIFEGLDNKNLPYRIIAKNVVEKKNDIFKLNEISGYFKISDGDLEINAESGIFNVRKKTVIISKNVKMTFNDFVLISEHINLDLNKNIASSKFPVEVNFKNSKIKASSFDVDDANNVINFKGNVISAFDFHDF